MRKFLFSRKQVTTYLLEFQRINTLPTLHQGVHSQRFRRRSFQFRSWALEDKGKPLSNSIIIIFRNYNKISNIKQRILNMKWKTYIHCFKNLTYRLLLNMCTFNFLRLFHVLWELKSCVRERTCLENNKVTVICKIYDFEYVTYNVRDFSRPGS